MKKTPIITHKRLIYLVALNLILISIFSIGPIGKFIFKSLSYVFGVATYVFLIALIAIIIFKIIKPKTKIYKEFIFISLIFINYISLISLDLHSLDFVSKYNNLIKNNTTYDYSSLKNLKGGFLGVYLINLIKPYKTSLIIYSIIMSLLILILLSLISYRLFIVINKKKQSKIETLKPKRKEKEKPKETPLKLLKEKEITSPNSMYETFNIFSGKLDINVEPTIEKEQEERIIFPKEELQTIKTPLTIDDFDDNQNEVIEEEEIEEKTNFEDIRHQENIIINKKDNYVSYFEEVKETIIPQSFEEDKNINLLYLLNEKQEDNIEVLLQEIAKANLNKINNKFFELNISARVINFEIGASVTRYEILPSEGVKVNSILNPEKDLKLALGVSNLRFEIPIRGRNTIGIEVENKYRKNVNLRSILEDKYLFDEELIIGLGEDIVGNSYEMNIKKLPHLLIAGSTGSGKSVCINTIIMSILLRTSPNKTKLLLIDPKRVEMFSYNNMPHLLAPVVLDPLEANEALKKVVYEIERRYEIFSQAGARDIKTYNNIRPDKYLFNIVVIIDELADLMMSAGKEIEYSIQRISQIARAAGVYLIVATQRPSVDVITGVIKANIASRISFAVSSQVDSRTILDQVGAEKLLGKGDMLIDLVGGEGLTRIQGAYVSDEEINRVVKYLKNKYSSDFDEGFANLKTQVIVEDVVNKNNNEDALLYQRIKSYVMSQDRISTSLLQRKFAIGFARASRMIDNLENDKIISKQDGNKSREVLKKE